MTIMEKIKDIMKEKGLSKADLVRLSGLKKPTVYRIFDENIDGSKIRIETLAPIAKALDVDLDYLLGKKETVIPNSLLDATEKIYERIKNTQYQYQIINEIFSKIPKLTDEQIHQLQLYINLFKDNEPKDTDN